MRMMTDDEIEKAVELIKKGYRVPDIAGHFGRSISTVSNYIRIATGVKNVSELRPKFNEPSQPTISKWKQNRIPLWDIPVEEIEVYALARLSLSAIAEKYGVSREAVRQLFVKRKIDYLKLKRIFDFKQYSIEVQDIIKRLREMGFKVTRSQYDKRQSQTRPWFDINGGKCILIRVAKSRSTSSDHHFYARYYSFTNPFIYDGAQESLNFLIVYLRDKDNILVVPSEDAHKSKATQLHIKDCRYGDHNYNSMASQDRLCTCKYENKFNLLEENSQ